MTYDLVFRGGQVVNGMGNAPFTADVAVKGKIIERIGTVKGKATRSIDIGGYLLVPGFIDMHSHSDIRGLLTDSDAETKAEQGVTTEVVGQCGISPAPTNKAFLFKTLVEQDTQYWNSFSTIRRPITQDAESR
jgi:N-acyl-D-amino-acid deacylase